MMNIVAADDKVFVTVNCWLKLRFSSNSVEPTPWFCQLRSEPTPELHQRQCYASNIVGSMQDWVNSILASALMLGELQPGSNSNLDYFQD